MASTTVRDIVTRAMREVNLIGADETPDSGEANKAVDQLNAMAMGWSADSINTGWSTVVLSDYFPLEPRHEEGVTFMLAKRLAGARGTALTPDQMRLAELGENRLASDYKAIEGLRVENGLAMMPSQRPLSRYAV